MNMGNITETKTGILMDPRPEVIINLPLIYGIPR